MPSGSELYFELLRRVDYYVVPFYYGVVLSYFVCRFLLYTAVTSNCLQHVFIFVINASGRLKGKFFSFFFGILCIRSWVAVR